MLCFSLRIDFRVAQTMIFAINEINNNSSLLPNVTLGYNIYDTCFWLRGELNAALSLVFGREEQFQLDDSCAGSPPVLGIVGPHYSSHAVAISNVLGLYRVPMVSLIPLSPLQM